MAPLSKEQLDAFLAQPLIARLGTVTSDGYPYITPIWYEWDGASVVAWVLGRAQFVANVRANPRASVSIVDAKGGTPRVLILGRAEIVCEDGNEESWATWALRGWERTRQYLGGDAAAADASWAQYRQAPGTVLRVVPEKIISWAGEGHHPRYAR